MKRGRPSGGTLHAYAGIVAAVLFLVSYGSARAQDMFVVEDVPVDITADTAANARDRGIEQATRQAFDRLTERLATEPGFGPPPRVSETAVQNLVEGIEIADEKASAVRYIAKITVRFRPDAVRGLYGRAGRDSYDRGPASAGRALLVVPVYEWAGSRVIWEQFNPWWQAWQDARQGGGFRLMLPRGDEQDVHTLSAEEAARADRARILALADRYAAAGALVARANFDRAGATPALDLVVTSFGGEPGAVGLVDRIQGTPGETVDALAERGVARVVAMLDGTGRGGLAPQAGAPDAGRQSTVVVADLDSPADLTTLRNAIRSVVAHEELISLSRRKASLRLFHSGDRELLRQSLSRSGIVVTDTPEGWSLSLPGSSASPPTSLAPALSGGR